MKQHPSHINFPHKLRAFFSLMALVVIICPAAFTQTVEVATDTITADSTIVEEASPEKVALRMSFEAFKINGDLKLLARVRSKVNTKFLNTAGVEITFYKNEIDPANLIGRDTSNQKGEALWIVPLVQNTDSNTAYTYFAEVKNHPDYEDAEETVSTSSSVLNIEFAEEDSMRLVKIFLGYPDSGGIKPVAETEVKLFVRRLFGDMPIGDPETTDEEGNVTIEFPSDIKGDTSGLITIVAKVTEHETLGNIETSKAISWGIPTVNDDFYSQRQLWSARSNSPIILIVVVNTVLLGIWGVIAYIFLGIFRINKIGRAYSKKI